MIKRKWSTLVLLCTMLAVGNAAWADSFMYAEENDDYTGWTDYETAACSGSTCTATITVSPNRTIYVGYATGTTYSTLYKGSISLSQSGLYWIQDQEKNGYHFVKFSTSTTAVNVSYNTSTHAYTITASSCTAPTVVTTNGASSITSLSATVGGTVTDGTCEVTDAGIAYGKSANPTSGVSVGYTSGTAFSTNLTALEANTTYYYRAYATTASGTTYGTEYSFNTTATASGTPTVHIGAKPTVSEENCGVTINAYLSQTGCSTVTGMTLYYSNNRSFRTDGSYKTKSIPLGKFPTTINNSESVTLTSAQVNNVVKPGETMYVRLSATNSSGTSPYSDVVPVPYVCGKFVTANLNKSFKACPGEHQFTWNDMFISPIPTTWTARLTSAGGVAMDVDATSDFTLTDGEMIWDTEDKEVTSYTYTFTGKKDGYTDATATLTITYTVPVATSGTITDLTATPSSTTPWTAVALRATGTAGDITKIYWTAQPDAEISNKVGTAPTATATFKAEAKTSTITYKVVVSGYNNTCGSVSKDVEVIVSPDTTETLCN